MHAIRRAILCLGLVMSLATASCLPDPMISTRDPLPDQTEPRERPDVDRDPAPKSDPDPDETNKHNDEGDADSVHLVFFAPGLEAMNRAMIVNRLTKTGLLDHGSMGLQIASTLQGRDKYPDRLDTQRYLSDIPFVVDRVLKLWDGRDLRYAYWDYEPRDENAVHWIRSKRFTDDDARLCQQVRVAIEKHLEGLGRGDMQLAIYGPRAARAAFAPRADDLQTADSITPITAGWDWQTVVLYSRAPIDVKAASGPNSIKAQRERVLGWIKYYRDLNPDAETIPMLRITGPAGILDEETMRLQVRWCLEAGAETIGFWIDASTDAAAKEHAEAIRKLAPVILNEIGSD